MTIVEAAKELNKSFKADINNRIDDRLAEVKNNLAMIARYLERINELEKIIINLAERIEILESRCQ